MQLATARVLIGMVIAWNVQAALAFILSPGAYAPGFELSGIPGTAAVQGTALLFIMWNIPYLVACWHPRRHIVSLVEALVMQTIGLIGESALLLSIPVEHASLRASITRFIIFDATGLLALAIALGLARASQKAHQART